MQAEIASTLRESEAVSHPGPGAQTVLRLPAELGIEQAESLKAELCAALADDEPVAIDARDLQRIHTAALQLFCLFCRDRRNAGRRVEWQQPSAALRSAAAMLGMTTLLLLSRETP